MVKGGEENERKKGKSEKNMVMKTLQIRIPKEHLIVLDKLVNKKIYPNRSEAVRDAVRKYVIEEFENKRIMNIGEKVKGK